MGFWLILILNFVLWGILAYYAFQARDLREQVEELQKNEQEMKQRVQKMKHQVEKYREKPTDLHFLDNALLPLWNALREHPPYDRMREIYNVHEASEGFLIRPIPVQDELIIALRKAAEEDLPAHLNELNEIRQELETLLRETIFDFYENMSIKEKTVTQLEEDNEFPDLPFWKWYLREHIGVSPEIPDHVDDTQFQFQRFFDNLINFRRETGDQVTSKFINDSFERIIEGEPNEDTKERLRNMKEALDRIAELIDEFTEGVDDLQTTVEEKIYDMLNKYEISNEEVEHDDLLTGFRQNTTSTARQSLADSLPSESSESSSSPEGEDETEISSSEKSYETPPGPLGEFKE